jgi:hypothetical protein
MGTSGKMMYHLIWWDDAGWPVSGLWSIMLTIEKVLHWSHIQKRVDLQDAITASWSRVWGLGRRIGDLWNEDISSDLMWRCGMTSIRFVIDCANNRKGLHWSHIQKRVDLQDAIIASFSQVWRLGRRLGCLANEDISSDLMWRCWMTRISFVIDRANNSKGLALITHSKVSRLPEHLYYFI